MSIGIRKVIVIGVVVFVLLLAKALVLAQCLAQCGLLGWAECVQREYLTGPAITVLVALLILLGPGEIGLSGWSRSGRRCAVCGHLLIGSENYCPECGSRL